MAKKGLWELLEEMGTSDPIGRRDWSISLGDLHFNLHAADFETPIGQLETELDRASVTHPDFGWEIEKRDGQYHFTAKK